MVRIGKINWIALLLVQFILVWSVTAATGLSGSFITIEGQLGELLTGGRRWAFQASNHTVGISTRALAAGSTGPSEFTRHRARFDAVGEPVKPGVHQTRRGFPSGEKGTELSISASGRDS